MPTGKERQDNELNVCWHCHICKPSWSVSVILLRRIVTLRTVT